MTSKIIAGVLLVGAIIAYLSMDTKNIVKVKSNGQPYYLNTKGDTTVIQSPTNALYYDTGRMNGNLASMYTLKKMSDSLCIMIGSMTTTISAGQGITVLGSGSSYTISLTAPTITTTARSANTNFTPSTTRYTLSIYSFSSSATNPLVAGSSSVYAYLEYSVNGGSTWLPASAPQTGNSSSVGLAVAVQLANGQISPLVGVIPPNAITRIRVPTATGTASGSVVSSFEFNFY